MKYLPLAAVALGLAGNTGAFAQTCNNMDVANAQQNSATQADLQLMQQAGSFVFGTVAEVAGAGAVESVVTQALGLATSGASSDVVGAELQCQQAEIQAINTELSQLQGQLTTLASDVARDHNNNLRNTVAQDYSRLAVDVAWLYPPSLNNPLFRNLVSSASVRSVMGGAQPPAPASSTHNSATPQISLQVANAVAVDGQAVADLYRSQFLSRWQGEDVANGSVTANFEPYPALHVYLTALQVWMAAIQFEEAAEGAQGFKMISQQFGSDLSQHLAFLKSRVAGGHGASSVPGDPAYNPLPDQITGQIACTWQVGTTYPQGSSHLCTAAPACQDNIQKKTWNANNAPSGWNGSQSFSFSVGNSNTMCTVNAASLPPIDMQPKLYSLYGMDAIATMQSMVDSLTRTGSMFAKQPVTGSFGSGSGPDTQSVFIYSVDGSGTVFRSQQSTGSQIGAAQQVATGWSNMRFLLPGGGNVFYTVGNNGALTWYNFQSTTAPVSGPVALSSTFGNYSNVFGGSDGVIYAIGQDGSLAWYRNTNINSGGGPSALTGPKSIGTGWGQYRAVFSAGSGVIYAVQADGTLLWFHHKDYLTGDSTDPVGSAPARVQKQPLPHAHWDGPLIVGSGWAGFRTIQAAGGGIVLAVKPDGTMLWYKQDDYLTGGSTSTSAGSPGSVGSGGVQTAPNWGSPAGQSQWGAPAGASGVRQGFTTPGAMGATAPTSAFGARPALAAANGTTMAANPGMSSSLTRSSAPTLQNTSLPTGSQAPGILQGTKNTNMTAAVAAKPHWEGPTPIGTGWQQYPLIAATLPGTVQAVIK